MNSEKADKYLELILKWIEYELGRKIIMRSDKSVIQSSL